MIDTEYMVKLGQELSRLGTGWSFEVGVDDKTRARITALKDDMIFVVRINLEEDALLVNGVYPSDLIAKAQTETIDLPDYRMEVYNHPPITMAGLIASTFIPKYARTFAILSGRIADDIAGRYSLAQKLEDTSIGLFQAGKWSGDNVRYPVLDGHGVDYDAHLSVRSGKMVQINLIVPGDIAVEIVNLLALLKGA